MVRADDSPWMRHVAVAASALAAWLGSARAWACPSCPAGKAARQQVIDQDFGTNLLITVLPFLLVGLFARCAERRDSREAGS